MMTTDFDDKCPLCMEKFEIDETGFYPCSCSFQICRFCWHRIRTDENGLCPACRQPYSEDPVAFCPIVPPKTPQLKPDKKQKDKKRELIESRKSLTDFRVIQRNLVYVVGLPQKYATEEMLKSIFGKHGTIVKLIISSLPSSFSTEPLNTAYISYSNVDDALTAIHENTNLFLDGHRIKVTLGTTKYCVYYLKGEDCPRQECTYLHHVAPREISFTKDEMQQGKHMDYERQAIINLYQSRGITLSPIKTANTESLEDYYRILSPEPQQPYKVQKEIKYELVEARKHLATHRVIQPNLVYVVGLPQKYANEEEIRNIFEKYGDIEKLIVGSLPSNFSTELLNTAYISYNNVADALTAIYENSNLRLGGHRIKVTLGTTKYCALYLKGEECNRQECSYLHQLADADISFTKEDMQQGKHMEYERQAIVELYRDRGISISSDSDN